MKLIFCLLLVFIFGAVAEDDETSQDKAIKWAQECIKELKVSQETLDKLEGKEYSDDPDMEKITFCMLKKAGKMTENGDLNLEPIKKDIQERISNEETVNKVLKDCVVKKDTPEETAGHMVRCVHRYTSASH